jgi:hypothetical protein
VIRDGEGGEVDFTVVGVGGGSGNFRDEVLVVVGGGSNADGVALWCADDKWFSREGGGGDGGVVGGNFEIEKTIYGAAPAGRRGSGCVLGEVGD